MELPRGEDKGTRRGEDEGMRLMMLDTGPNRSLIARPKASDATPDGPKKVSL
jgi:hypothetical protein